MDKQVEENIIKFKKRVSKCCAQTDDEDEEYASIDSETSDISDNEHAADNAEGSDVDSVGSYEEDEDEDEHNSDDDDDGEGERRSRKWRIFNQSSITFGVAIKG